MKTEGLTIQEAIIAFQENKCEAIQEVAGYVITTTLPDYALSLSAREILGTWKLINPVITPEPGEVWELDNKQYWMTLTYILDIYGATALFDMDTMIHNQNGWERVYPTVEEQP